MIKLIKNAEVYAPKYLGRKDVMIAADKICKISELIVLDTALEFEEIDATGKILFPGFILDAISWYHFDINLDALTRILHGFVRFCLILLLDLLFCPQQAFPSHHPEQTAHAAGIRSLPQFEPELI